MLVLDLDETLIRVCCDGVHHNRQLGQVDFRLPIDVGLRPKVSTFDCGVSIRPGMERFLDWIQDRREAGLIEGPWIYTTSTPNYTKALLRRIDPGGKIFAMRVLTRDACSPSRLPGFFLKDLGRVPPKEDSGAAQRKLLVDNNPVSFVINPENSVLVRDWLGDNPDDTELDRVCELLEAVVQGRKADDYAGHLSELIPGHELFRQRLQVLGAQLDSEPPSEVDQLRSALRAVSAECHDIKLALLGAAP